MTIAVFISITDHVVAGVYNSFSHYLLCIPFAISKNLHWLWFFTWWDDPNLLSRKV